MHFSYHTGNKFLFLYRFIIILEVCCLTELDYDKIKMI